VTDRKGHDRRYSLDDTKLRGLGYAPRHDFTSGLAETVDWYRSREEWWRPLRGR
jgi:dTDP-glucose 4,6-dehydratase